MTSNSSLPKPKGSFRVGNFSTTLIDQNRKTLEHPDGLPIPLVCYFPVKIDASIDKQGSFQKPNFPICVDIYPEFQALGWSQCLDLNFMCDETQGVVFINHANLSLPQDYGIIAENLASFGFVVFSFAHQLSTDQKEPDFYRGRSISKRARIIDNLLFVGNWIEQSKSTVFYDRLDLSKVALIGHSMGADAILLLANRSSGAFVKNDKEYNKALLFRGDGKPVRQCAIILDPCFGVPFEKTLPMQFWLSEEWYSFSKQEKTDQKLKSLGFEVFIPKGSMHMSFFDEGYFDPTVSGQKYFNGTEEQRVAFFETLNKEILRFIMESLFIKEEDDQSEF